MLQSFSAHFKILLLLYPLGLMACSADQAPQPPAHDKTQHPTNDVKKMPIQPGPTLGKDSL